MSCGDIPIVFMQYGQSSESEKRGDDDDSGNGASIGVEQDNHGSL